MNTFCSANIQNKHLPLQTLISQLIVVYIYHREFYNQSQFYLQLFIVHSIKVFFALIFFTYLPDGQVQSVAERSVVILEHLWTEPKNELVETMCVGHGKEIFSSFKMCAVWNKMYKMQLIAKKFGNIKSRIKIHLFLRGVMVFKTQYFSYIMAVSFNSGGNQRKPLTNFIIT